MNLSLSLREHLRLFMLKCKKMTLRLGKRFLLNSWTKVSNPGLSPLGTVLKEVKTLTILSVNLGYFYFFRLAALEKN